MSTHVSECERRKRIESDTNETRLLISGSNFFCRLIIRGKFIKVPINLSSKHCNVPISCKLHSFDYHFVCFLKETLICKRWYLRHVWDRLWICNSESGSPLGKRSLEPKTSQGQKNVSSLTLSMIVIQNEPFLITFYQHSSYCHIGFIIGFVFYADLTSA